MSLILHVVTVNDVVFLFILCLLIIYLIIRDYKFFVLCFGGIEGFY